MITRIDLASLLRRTVCELYCDLVTRPTGAAVRTGIEEQLLELPGRTLTVIDFSHVGLLDFSCADEIVAKLLVRYHGGDAPREAYFLLAGVHEMHVEPIEAVLERRRLTIEARTPDGLPELLGIADGEERTVWAALERLGRAEAADVASACGVPRDAAAARLDALCDRRVVMRDADAYIALGAVAQP